jgi:hypothetical protein
MSTKPLFTISLLLPLVAISATAYAGSTITDKSYWPSETGKSAQYRTVGSPGDVFAYEPAGSHLQPATTPSWVGSAWQYRGGPKGR